MICVYKILSPDLQECYVGSTTDYPHRIYVHKSDIKKPCRCKILFDKYGFNNCKFVVLEQCTKEELKIKEQWWMDHSVGLVNNRTAIGRKKINGSDRHKYLLEHKAQKKEYDKVYCEANREKISEKRKARYELKKQIKNLA